MNVKDEINKRAKKSFNSKVKSYIEKYFLEKISHSGSSIGIWLENLETHFDSIKPEGALKGFSQKDFDELYFVLFGIKK